MARRAVEFLRRHPGLVLVAGVVVLVAGTAVNRVLDEPISSTSDENVQDEESSVDESGGDGSPSDEDGEAAADDEAAEDDGDAPGDTGAAASPSNGDRAGDAGTTTTLVPPDVARPRPEVDLDAPPDGSDPVEVARWWAAVYVAYVGAEPPAELVDRLGPLTTRELQNDLRSMSSVASYSGPTPVEGVSAREPAARGSTGQRGQNVWVTVETPGALVVYDVVLQRESGGWRVSEANRL